MISLKTYAKIFSTEHFSQTMLKGKLYAFTNEKKMCLKSLFNQILLNKADEKDL